MGGCGHCGIFWWRISLLNSVGDTRLQDENVTSFKKDTVSSLFLPLFLSLSGEMGHGGGLECYLFVEKCQEDFWTELLEALRNPFVKARISITYR